MRNLEGWWRLRGYLQRGRSEDARTVQHAESIMAYILLIDFVVLAVLASGFMLLKRDIGLWLVPSLYATLVFTGGIIAVIGIGVQITSSEEGHAEMLVAVRLQQALDSVNTRDRDVARERKRHFALLDSLVAAVRDFDTSLHILVFKVNSELLNSILSYSFTGVLTLASLWLSNW